MSKFQFINPHDYDVKFNGEMLEFHTPISFFSVLEALSKSNEGCPEIDEIDIFQAFENSFDGFYSLRREIAKKRTLIENNKGITRKNDPELKYIPDPYIQTLLNAQQKVKVEGKEIKLTKDGLVFENEKDAIEEKKRIETNPEIQKSGSAKNSCCVLIKVKHGWVTYANHSHMAISTSVWVYGLNLWGTLFMIVGGRTINYRKDWKGRWVRRKAEKVLVQGQYIWKQLTCANQSSKSRVLQTSFKFNSNSVSRTNFDPSGVISFVTKFNTAHVGIDNSDSALNYMDICK